MILKNNHFFLTSAPEIKAITKPLLSLGITYFGYSRYYNNGGRLWLCNTPENLENYYSTKQYRIGNTECHPSTYQPQIALWSTLPNQLVFESSRQLGVDHGIFIIDPQEDYCEFFSFASTPDNYKIINTYLTHIDFLKKFSHYFKETAKDIINIGEDNKLFLPYHSNALPQINTSPLLTETAVLPTKLTNRQLACAKQLVKGYTVKEIAAQQNLSPRTVETYLNNIKTKLFCRNKTELITKLLENNLY